MDTLVQKLLKYLPTTNASLFCFCLLVFLLCSLMKRANQKMMRTKKARRRVSFNEKIQILNAAERNDNNREQNDDENSNRNKHASMQTTNNDDDDKHHSSFCCFYCGYKGHLVRDCWKKIRTQLKRKMSLLSNNSNNKKKRTTRKCPNQQQQQHQQQSHFMEKRKVEIVIKEFVVGNANEEIDVQLAQKLPIITWSTAENKVDTCELMVADNLASKQYLNRFNEFIQDLFTFYIQHNNNRRR